jgi:hypothetical protein
VYPLFLKKLRITYIYIRYKLLKSFFFYKIVARCKIQIFRKKKKKIDFHLRGNDIGERGKKYSKNAPFEGKGIGDIGIIFIQKRRRI